MMVRAGINFWSPYAGDQQTSNQHPMLPAYKTYLIFVTSNAMDPIFKCPNVTKYYIPLSSISMERFWCKRYLSHGTNSTVCCLLSSLCGSDCRACQGHAGVVAVVTTMNIWRFWWPDLISVGSDTWLWLQENGLSLLRVSPWEQSDGKQTSRTQSSCLIWSRYHLC